MLGNLYPPQTLGGYELMCRDHVARLRANGHEVTVLVTSHGSGQGVRETGAHGETVVRALRFQWRDYELRRLSGAELWREERRQRLVLRRVIREQRPDLVFVWHMAAVSKSLLGTVCRRGLAMVAVIGEQWPAWDIEEDAWLRFWHGRARRRWMRLPKALLRPVADRLVAPVRIDEALRATLPVYCSDYLRELVEGSVEPWRGRGRVVPNGIDLARFEPPGDPDRPLHRPLRLLYLGRVERRKGVQTAVEALAVLRAGGVPCRLDVVGWRDEVFVAEAKAEAERLGVAAEVAWMDAVPESGVAAVYRDHDVLLFPTLWEEPFGLVPLEAMATGCLVVATGTGGSREILADGRTALTFPPGDAHALAACVVRLVTDRGLRQRLRLGGLRCAEEHSFDRYVEALDSAAAAVLDGSVS